MSIFRYAMITVLIRYVMVQIPDPIMKVFLKHMSWARVP